MGEDELEILGKRISESARAGRVDMEQPHCKRRMRERQITAREIRYALVNPMKVARSRPDQYSDWTVEGPDLDGAMLTVAVRIDGGRGAWLTVVTVY